MHVWVLYCHVLSGLRPNDLAFDPIRSSGIRNPKYWFLQAQLFIIFNSKRFQAFCFRMFEFVLHFGGLRLEWYCIRFNSKISFKARSILQYAQLLMPLTGMFSRATRFARARSELFEIRLIAKQKQCAWLMLFDWASWCGTGANSGRVYPSCATCCLQHSGKSSQRSLPIGFQAARRSHTRS